MWDVLRELGRAVREALRDWPGMLRLLWGCSQGKPRSRHGILGGG